MRVKDLQTVAERKKTKPKFFSNDSISQGSMLLSDIIIVLLNYNLLEISSS